MELIIEPYNALPCHLQVFEINGIKAYEGDFGESDSSPDGNWGCDYHIFCPYEEPKDDVLEKYNITIDEYKEICEKLEIKLDVGPCGWCS